MTRRVDLPERTDGMNVERLPARQTPLIKLSGVAKTYRAADGVPVKAVDSVSADIVQGEFVSILGPSGCGKSTLMMMIAGLLTPSAGSVSFRGSAVNGPLRDFGVVFQDAVLLPWRNVVENVELPGEVAGVPRGERRAASEKMLAMVGLAGFERKFPHELSGGMQQRVAIARALSLNPTLLLMDEPFGALDAMTREQMNLELQRISLESGATVVFVTHSIAEAAFLSDRVFVMSGRPSTVREIVSIDIPRPRAIDLLASDRLGIHISTLRRLLDVKGDPS
ncbi:MAG: ABC transporter ATP-binding protein [Rhizobiaceae bacterium]